MRKEAGEVWLDTNSILFRHTLEYQNKLSDFFTESEDATEVFHDHIWTVVVKVMEDSGKPMANGLGITMHLVDMLPTIPIYLAFHSSTPGLTRFMPEVYAAQPKFRMDALDFSHMPPLQSDRKALDVLHEEIFNMCGAPEMAKAVEPAWCLAMSDVSTIGVKACEVGASDGPTSSPRTSHSPGWHSQTSLGIHGVIHKVPDPVHLPLAPVPGQGACQVPVVQDYCNQAPTPNLMLDPKHLQKAAVSSGSGCSHSASPDVVLLQGNDEDTAVGGEEDAGHSEDEEALSQGTVS